MKTLFTLLGLASALLVIWFGGPLSGIPYLGLDVVRFAAMGICVLLVLAGVAASHMKRRRSAGAIERALMRGEGFDDSKELSDRMADALAQLKKAYGSTYLYDLPWYAIIGPPGAGKTTALAYSGLRFPVAGAGAGALEGFGGTRYCDWWFAEDAILIDTAGRYTSQDSDAQSDGASWLSFLTLLKKTRSKQPLNGVILAFSVEDMMRATPETLLRHADTVRMRLAEMQRTLKVDLPVYVVFTKADLIPGFRETFSSLSQEQREQAWGVTFQTKDRRAQTVESAGPEFDRLTHHLTASLVDQMQTEPDPIARAAMLELPGQLALLKTPILSFLNAVFQPTAHKAKASLRGFYFCSGTQEGTPFDQALGALQRLGQGPNDPSAGMAFGSSLMSGKGKSFFLRDLLQEVVFQEQFWVGYSRRAVLRTAILRSFAMTLIMVFTLGALGVLGAAYWQNATLVQNASAQLQTYQKVAGPELGRTHISDPSPLAALPALNELRAVALSVSDPKPLVPWEVAGLDQSERVKAAAVQAYSDALEQMLRPRMILWLENQFPFWQQDAATADTFLGLKSYMLLGGQGAQLDDDAVKSYFASLWAQDFGAEPLELRELQDHLSAMLALDDGRALLVGIQAETVNSARDALSASSLVELSYALVLASTRTQNLSNWDPVAESSGALTWVDAAPVPVPSLFTAAGFEGVFLPALDRVSASLSEDAWVLGGQASGLVQQTDLITPRVMELYAEDFLSSWNDTLSNLNLQSLTSDAPSYTALAGFASAGGSALLDLQDNVVLHTNLTLPVDAIQRRFEPWRRSQSGALGTRPIDEVLGHFQSAYLALVGPDSLDPIEVSDALDPLASVRLLLPDALQRLVIEAEAQIRRHAIPADLAQMQAALTRDVFDQCQQTISPFFPFAPSNDSVSLADFGAFFGPGGQMDRYFSKYLRPHVQINGSSFLPHPDSPIASELSPSALMRFAQAAQIRDAFFGNGRSPRVGLFVTHVDNSDDVESARLVINDMLVETIKGDVPVLVQWPGTGANAGLELLPQARDEPSGLALSGSAWDALRLLQNASSRSVQGDQIRATFVLGSRQITYELRSDVTPNPFALRALSQFRCPQSLR